MKKIQNDLAKKEVKFTFSYVYDELGKRVGILGNISLPNGSSGSFSTKTADGVYRVSSKFEDGDYQWVSLKGVNSLESNSEEGEEKPINREIEEEPTCFVFNNEVKASSLFLDMQETFKEKDIEFTFKDTYENGKLIDVKGTITLSNGLTKKYHFSGEKFTALICFDPDLSNATNIRISDLEKDKKKNDWVEKGEEEVEVVSEEAKGENSFTFELEPEENIIGIESNNTFEKKREIEKPIIESIDKGQKIKIRGNSGANGDLKPLFIIDGKVVKSDKKSIMQEIDPNDIESINVLKGESAIEAYGQEGENGVIEIVTKFDKRPKSERERTIELKIKEKKKAEKSEKYKLEKQLKEKEKGSLEQELLKKEKLKQEKIKYQKLQGKKKSKPLFGKEALEQMGDRPLFIIDGEANWSNGGKP